MVALLNSAVTICILGCAAASFLSAAPGGSSQQDLKASDVPESLGSLVSSLSLGSPEEIGPYKFEKIELVIEAILAKGTPDEPTRIAIQQMKGVVDTLIPKRKKAQEADQKLLDAQMDALKNCREERQSNIASLGLPSTKEHFEEQLGKHASCVEMEEGKALVSEAYCHKKDVDKICSCLPDPEHKECCEAHSIHQDQQVKCKQMMQDIEQQRTLMKKVCQQYSTCYNKELQEYTKLEKRVKQSEEHRAWRSLYKIKCLLDAHDAENPEDASKACKAEKITIPKIKYSEIPARDECIL